MNDDTATSFIVNEVTPGDPSTRLLSVLVLIVRELRLMRKGRAQ